MKLVLVGKAASGKDFLKQHLAKQGHRASVSYTTRKPRDGESNGVHYHFIDTPEFEAKRERGEFVEQMRFDHSRYYGTTIQAFEDADVIILSPDGLTQLAPQYRRQCIVMWLNPPLVTRLQRLRERGDAPDKIRARQTLDDKQFEDFGDYDIMLRDVSCCGS